MRRATGSVPPVTVGEDGTVNIGVADDETESA
jgi:hypothetical protein